MKNRTPSKRRSMLGRDGDGRANGSWDNAVATFEAMGGGTTCSASEKKKVVKSASELCFHDDRILGNLGTSNFSGFSYVSKARSGWPNRAVLFLR